MSTVDSYVVMPHPQGGYAAIPVDSVASSRPAPTDADWRFPTVGMALLWADAQMSPQGVSIHQSCNSSADTYLDFKVSEPKYATPYSSRTRLLYPVVDDSIAGKLHRQAHGEENVWDEGEPVFSDVSHALFSNSITFPHDASWASEGVGYIAEAIAQRRGDEVFVDSSMWAAPYSNELFDMRPYCWCDGNEAGHELACPANFTFKPTGLQITWYLNARRGITASAPQPDNWVEIVVSCIESVREGEDA